MKDKLISDKLSDNQMLEDLQRLLDEELAEAGDEPALFVLAGALVRKLENIVVFSSGTVGYQIFSKIKVALFTRKIIHTHNRLQN